MGELFAIAVSIVIAGFLWFYVARPILEDFGIIKDGRTVKHSPVVMSRAEQDATENTPLSLRQTEPQTDRPPLTREIMLDVYKLLREHNVSRERARPVLKAAGIPLDNNLWTQAAPPLEEPISVTPIAGRPTSAEFRDPELTYQPPPR